MHPHLSRDVSQHNVSVFQLYSEHGVRESLNNLSLHLNRFFLRHAFVFSPEPSVDRMINAPGTLRP